MTGNKTTSSEIVLELINLISKPAFKREANEIEFVLPWLCKRSLLLQRQPKGVLVDIVKNCTILSCFKDDVVIKQGDRGDSYFEDFCFYIILRGSASVYIDPKMTGEGTNSEDGLSRTSARKKKTKKPPQAPESEPSVLSGMEKPDSEGEAKSEVDKETQEEENEKKEEIERSETDMQMKKKPTKPLAPVDRNKFGKFIASYGVGSAFGEVALVNKDTFRNASIIVDEDTDMMVIGQELFDRSLRADQEAKYAEIRAFIEEHPFFKEMNQRFKKLLEMSIRKERYIFDTHIIKQGEPVVGLHFMISGSANISIQPKKHVQQYPHLWPFEAGVDQIAIEFEHLREARRAAILRKYEDPSVWETKPEELIIRREQGYAAIEKKMKENHINLCSVQTKEVLGDVETLLNLGEAFGRMPSLNLSTYMQTVRCTSDTTCFVLDTKNFERLIGKKTNPQTIDIMREYVKSKLFTRMQMRNADLIPLLGFLHQKLTEQSLPPAKKVEPFKVSKSVPDVEEEMQHLLQYFKEGKEVVLIKPCVPGVVYYHELMQEKAKAREAQRKAKGSDSITLGSLRRRGQQRKPRSMLQIRESLKQMMEAEVIEMETKKFRKRKKKSAKGKRKKSREQNISDRSYVKESPKTLIELANEKEKDSKPGLMNLMKAAVEKKREEENKTKILDGAIPLDAPDFAATSDLPKATPPVFVTELSKPDLKLPAIREEKTQEEIMLKGAATDVPKQTNDKPESKSPTRNINSEIPKEIDNKSPKGTKGATRTKHENNVLPPVQQPQAQTLNQSSPQDKRSPKGELVPKLPALGGSQPNLNQTEDTQRTDATAGSSSSSHWQTAISFVNERVQKRLTDSIMTEESDYKDFETSDPSLRLLEHKIQAFHVKYGKGDKTKNLPPLKRYKLDQKELPSVQPKPGGKVWVKKQVCKFSNSEFQVKDHKHVRYRMVESIPEFDKVHKSRVVVQQMLKTADFGS